MKLSQMFRTALIATAMVILSSGLDVRAFAQTDSPQATKNIVLVHGAWADGPCWSESLRSSKRRVFMSSLCRIL